MKTIALLHREELTDLFVGISRYVDSGMRVIHIAFGDKEVAMLRKVGIEPDYNYSQLLSDNIDKIIQNGSNLNTLREIDEVISKYTNGRFNLNASLQSDRGYSILSYHETLLLAQAHYSVWKKIFSSGKIDIILHEPCSLFFNHLGAIMCKAQGGSFIWQCMVAAEKEGIYYLNIAHDDFSCPEIEANYKFYLENYDKVDVKRCDNFIVNFRSSYDIYLSNLQPHISKWKYWISSLKRLLSIWVNRNKFDKLKDNIDYWLNLQNPARNKLRNLHNYQKLKINFQEPLEGENYYYYSFHLEPEAVVLYLGDGIYANQVKLIENIAASLPVGNYLYVKDHPHEFAYRSAEDFLRLQKIPNIRLIHSRIPGKSLIKNSLGVFTINGTAGFEGLMLGKQVYCFGKSYYTCSTKVSYIGNIRDLREQLYRKQHLVYDDDKELYAFVNAYLESIHFGMVDFFMNRATSYGIDLDENAKKISADLINFSQRF